MVHQQTTQCVAQQRKPEFLRGFLRRSGMGCGLLAALALNGLTAQALTKSNYESLQRYDYSSDADVHNANYNLFAWSHRAKSYTPGPSQHVRIMAKKTSTTQSVGIGLGWTEQHISGWTTHPPASFTSLSSTTAWYSFTRGYTGGDLGASSLNIFANPTPSGSTAFLSSYEWRVRYTEQPDSPDIIFDLNMVTQMNTGMTTWPSVQNLAQTQSAPGLEGLVEAPAGTTISKVAVSIQRESDNKYWHYDYQQWLPEPAEIDASFNGGTGPQRWVLFNKMPNTDTVGEYDITVVAFDSTGNRRCTENKTELVLRRVVAITYNNSGAVNASVSESASSLPITFTLDRAHTSNISIQYQAVPAGSGPVYPDNVATPYVYGAVKYDFTPVQTSVTIPAGQTSVTVNIPLHDDAFDEVTERFIMEYNTGATHAVLNDEAENVFIQDNDATPTLAINNPTPATVEGNSGNANMVNFTVTLSAASNLAVTVAYYTGNESNSNSAQANVDYESQTGTLTFQPGEVSKTISVRVKGDTTVEPAEVFWVRLNNPTNATIVDSQGNGYIANDDGLGGLLFNGDAADDSIIDEEIVDEPSK